RGEAATMVALVLVAVDKVVTPVGVDGSVVAGVAAAMVAQ
nr:hypothetical protein [Tanacetum cinerariifolium]